MSKNTEIGKLQLSSNLAVVGVIANGSLGTAGQVLTSNGTGTYWSAASGTASVVMMISTGQAWF